MQEKYNICIVIGTRPEAIKLVPLIIEFKKNKKFNLKVILTGQHNEMVTQVMDLFGLNCDLNLNLMRQNQTLSYLTSEIINKFGEVLKKISPQLVIVQGDTTSAMAASLAAFYEKIPVGHVEAGLRTNKIYNPFPEEINRRLISQIASLHFAPTKKSLQNLNNINIKKNVFLTGNTVIDALLFVKKKEFKFPFKLESSETNKIILITVHRRENWGSNLESIMLGLKKILEFNKNIQLILPMHRNIKVRKVIQNNFKDKDRALLCEPLNYSALVGIMKKSYMILTDSGGIQEEAPTLGKPVLILRNTTERPEVVDCGAAKLIGTNSQNIFTEVNRLLSDESLYKLMSNSVNPFGDGNASNRIVDICKGFLEEEIK